jgi:hypothetical protein
LLQRYLVTALKPVFRRLGAIGKMNIKMDVPLGEFFDKLSILEIKSKRLRDPQKLANNNRLMEALRQTWQGSHCENADIENQYQKLKAVNERLWEIEDQIREKEAQQRFDAEFIELARSVYITNDARAELKNEFNRLFQSEFTEEKSYTDYRRAQQADHKPPKNSDKKDND